MKECQNLTVRHFKSSNVLAWRSLLVVYPPRGSWPKQGDEHPAYTLHGAWQTLPYLSLEVTLTISHIFN